MANVVAFPKVRKDPQPQTAVDVIDMIRKEAERRQCSHVFAALVNDDGTVSRWAFSAAEIEKAMVFRDLMQAIDSLYVEAASTVPVEETP